MEHTKSVSGFSVEGEWLDVVEMGERIVFALSNTVCDEYPEDIERFNSWRPKLQEDFSTDMNRKTSREASLNPDDRRIDGKDDSFVQRLSVFLYDSIVEIFARTEEFVYQNVMTRMSPYYFDSRLLSANLRKKGSNLYKIEVNINDDNIKTEIAEKLRKYQEKYNRWHVGIDIDDSTLVPSEGLQDNTQRSDVDDYHPKR